MGVQERESADGFAVPFCRRDERDLILVQPLRPRVVILRLPAKPTEQHHPEIGFSDQFQLRCRLDQLGCFLRK